MPILQTQILKGGGGLYSPHISTIQGIDIANIYSSNTETFECGFEENGELHLFDEIWYTSTDGKIIQPYSSATANVNLISNTYEKGRGILKFEGNVETISRTFNLSSTLKTCSLPNSITTVDTATFQQCIELTTVKLSDKTEILGDACFNKCYKLENISLPKTLTTLGQNVFYNCSKIQEVILPDTLKVVNNKCFLGCQELSSVIFSTGVTSIGVQSFANCIKLKNIVIPDLVTTINEGAFALCSALTSCIIGSGVTSIGKNSFYGCNNLSSLTMGNNIVTISDNAFVQNYSLNEFTLSTNLVTLGKAILSSNMGIKDFHLPKTLRYLGYSATTYGDIFPNYLDNITIDSENPYLTLDNKSVYSKDGTILYGGADWGIRTSYQNYEIKEGVTTIYPGAFRTIGPSIETQEEIDTQFATYHLTRPHMYVSSVTLTSVTIPSTCTYIGDRFMQYSKGIQSITIKAINPPTLQTTVVFNGSTCPIYVPASSVDTYKTATNWKTFASRIQAIP